MIVVFIISMLATLALPAVRRVRMRARSAAIANDFRTFAAAFDAYAQETGQWPADVAAGVMPAGMTDRLGSTAWQRQTPMGGRYNWEYNQLHFGVRYKAAISIAATAASPLPLDVNQLLDLERRLDDGNLLGGSFRIGTGLVPLFIIQP
jgi:type II secretory pathway pseudopilin PulG